jgi:hypothetical protein
MPMLAVGLYSSHMFGRRHRSSSTAAFRPKPKLSVPQSRCRFRSQNSQRMAGPVDGRVRLIRRFLAPQMAKALMEAAPIHRPQTAPKKRHSRR